MAHQHTRVLFLGRNQSIANDLRRILCAEFRAPVGSSISAGASGCAAVGLHANGNGVYSTLRSDNTPPPPVLQIEFVTSQKIAMPVAQSFNPSLILIEASNKPDSRLRFCQWLRERLPAAVIVAVGSAVLPYRFEFDGVLQTPIEVTEVQRLFSRLQPTRVEVVRRGAIELDPATRIVRTPRGESELTPKESALLQMLMERDGALVKRAEIIQCIWQTSYLDDTRTLDVHMRWLRRKIEPDPSDPVYLITRRGEGYLFRVPAAAEENAI